MNLRDIRDVSDSVDALKACLDGFFNLIKEHCVDGNMLKKSISVCMHEASTNTRCNNSLAIKESNAKGLLNDIKESLMNLCYLSSKSRKELRYLKSLIDELYVIVDFTDNFIDDDGVALPTFQRAINKFGIYLANFKNFDKKREKSVNEG